MYYVYHKQNHIIINNIINNLNCKKYNNNNHNFITYNAQVLICIHMYMIKIMHVYLTIQNITKQIQ